MVAYMKNKTQQSSHRIFDLKAGEQAFKELEATLRAIPAQDIAIPNCDVQDSAISALALVDVANAPASKERFDWLADEIFKKDTVERLERVAWAAWYAHVRMRSEAAVETETKVDPATFEAAGSLLTKMLKLIDYHVGDRTEVAAEIDDIRSGSGYQDRASDLVRAAALWERWRAELDQDTRFFDPKDGEQARAYAEGIVRSLRAAHRANTAAWNDLRARAWTLLNELYSEVRAAGTYLFRHEPAERDRFTALRQTVSPTRGRPKAPPAEPEPVPTEPEPARAPGNAGTPST